MLLPQITKYILENEEFNTSPFNNKFAKINNYHPSTPTPQPEEEHQEEEKPEEA